MTTVLLRLDENESKKLEKIRTVLGLKSNAEVIRFLLNNFFRRLEKKGGYIDADSDAEVF